MRAPQRLLSLMLFATLTSSGTSIAATTPVKCPTPKGAQPLPEPVNDYQRLYANLCVQNVQYVEETFSKLQRDFESGADPRYEKAYLFEMFESAQLPATFTVAWLKQYPKSYSAHVAAGAYEYALGGDARGTAYARDTSQAQFREMSEHFRIGREYLDRSLTLTGKPFPSYRVYIQMGLFEGPRQQLRDYYDRAVALAPGSMDIRLLYMYSLQTRWGGGPDAMMAFANDKTNAKLSESQKAKLRSRAIFERARLADERDDPEEVLKYANEANKVFADIKYLDTIISAKWALKKYQEALGDLNRALEMSPDDVDFLRKRGTVLWLRGDEGAAYVDFLAASKQGDAYSQNKVGFLLWYGKGVPANRDEAVAWWKKASAGGDKDAAKNLDMAKARGHKVW